MKGKLIVFEGIDRSGKSTQIKNITNWLDKNKRDYLLVREPGSTPVGEAIRNILLKSKSSITEFGELCLYLAARSQIVQDVIKPALRDGRLVICDRFYFSTISYQGYARGIDIDLLEKMDRRARQSLEPDAVFYIDITLDEFKRRGRDESDRMEEAGDAFFEKVISGYAKQFENLENMIYINGVKSESEVFDEILVNFMKLAD